MTNPGLPANSLPPDFGSFMRRLQTLEREFKMMQGARTLENATVGAGGIRSANFDGDLAAGTAGTAGWGLSGSTGDAIFNDLVLRGHIIGNDALATPVFPTVAHSEADTFALTTTRTQVARVDITVPAGFSQALVMGTVTASARNTTAAQDFLDAYVDINGANSGWDAVADGQPGYVIGVANTATALLTGLTSGGTFYVRAMLASGVANWSADSYNTVNVDAMVLFLR